MDFFNSLILAYEMYSIVDIIISNLCFELETGREYPLSIVRGGSCVLNLIVY